MTDEARKDPGPRGGMAGSASRMNARATLQDRIERLRREADQLEALSNLLPLQIPPEADVALWQLLVARKI